MDRAIGLLKDLFGFFKKFINMPDNVQVLTDNTADCIRDIKDLTHYVDSINGVVSRIEKYGSEGAVKAIKEVGLGVKELDNKLQDREGKLYTRIKELDDKLDVASLALAHLQGIVVNGKKP
jgi:hypothetical protein